VAARSQRRALGALFFVLAALFCGMALAAGGAEVWVIAIAAGVLGLWMLGLAVRAWRR
jgi:heme O synthase-like polyprenyltransferase